MSKSGNLGLSGAGSNVTRPGYRMINKYGVNFDIDTGETPIEIWSHGSGGPNFPFLDAGIAMDVKSTSASDTLAGIGAQKLRITYYLTDNTEVTADYDLNGLTAVQVADDVKICTRIEVIQTGSSNTNIGEIDLVDRATGLVVYQSVEISEGQTLSAIQICPKGKQGVVVCHDVSYAKEQSPLSAADMRFQLRKVDGSVLTKHVSLVNTAKPKDSKQYPNGSGIAVAAGEIVYWECITVGANSTPIEARFDMEIFDL